MTNSGTSGTSACIEEDSGVLKLSTEIVMMTAMTPSVKYSSRLVSICLSNMGRRDAIPEYIRILEPQEAYGIACNTFDHPQDADDADERTKDFDNDIIVCRPTKKE